MISSTTHKELFDEIRKESIDNAIFKSEMKMYDHLIESASVLSSGCKEFTEEVERHIDNAKRILNRI